MPPPTHPRSCVTLTCPTRFSKWRGCLLFLLHNVQAGRFDYADASALELLFCAVCYTENLELRMRN
jgi:hypothetical protein